MKFAGIAMIIEAIAKLIAYVRAKPPTESLNDDSVVKPARKAPSKPSKEKGFYVTSFILWSLLFFLVSIFLWVPSEYFTSLLVELVASIRRGL